MADCLQNFLKEVKTAGHVTKVLLSDGGKEFSCEAVRKVLEEYGITHRLAMLREVVPKVMSNFFLHANWEQQTKESAVVDGTSCCVILECLVTSIACIT